MYAHRAIQLIPPTQGTALWAPILAPAPKVSGPWAKHHSRINAAYESPVPPAALGENGSRNGENGPCCLGGGEGVGLRGDARSFVTGEGDEMFRERWGRESTPVSALSPSSEPVAKPSSTSSLSGMRSFLGEVGVSGGVRVADCPLKTTRDASDEDGNGMRGASRGIT